MSDREEIKLDEEGGFTFQIRGVHRDLGRSFKLWFGTYEAAHVFMSPDKFREVGQAMIDVANEDSE